MVFLDFILIFILAFTTALGFFFGLFRVLGAIATIAVSIIIAGLFFSPLSLILKPYLLDNDNFSRVAAFIALYWITSFFLSLAVKIVNKIFELPILRGVNRLMGGIVSLLGAVLVLSVFFYLLDAYTWADSLNSFLQQSVLVQYLVLIGKYVSVAIPGL